MSILLPAYSMQEYDAAIDSLYALLSRESFSTALDRLAFISEHFLGRPYLGGALGEGPEALFDQSPLYRTDSFDCLTYVSTVLALSFSNDLATFKQTLCDMSYRGAVPLYEKRHHFMSADWNPRNAARGYIKDITTSIFNSAGEAVALSAEAYIDRPNWMQHRTLADIKQRSSISSGEAGLLLDQMHALSNQLVAEVAKMPYLPIEFILEQGDKAEKQIPHGVVIEIVRPNWDLRDKIGTCLNVSHLGFGFWLNNKLMFRQASTEEKRIVDTPFKEYLQWCSEKIPTVKGINLQRPLLP